MMSTYREAFKAGYLAAIQEELPSWIAYAEQIDSLPLDQYAAREYGKRVEVEGEPVDPKPRHWEWCYCEEHQEDHCWEVNEQAVDAEVRS
jgi:hypothetical protein